jgi:hypothetical protein
VPCHLGLLEQVPDNLNLLKFSGAGVVTWNPAGSNDPPGTVLGARGAYTPGATLPPGPASLSKENPEPGVLAKMFNLSLMFVFIYKY